MNSVVEKIRREAAKRKVISFARFMELALYYPVCGYYEKEKDCLGRRGDFYTSVSVGGLLGELLAFQFAGWLATLDPQPSTLNLVEAGAHDGQLAKDILVWLRAHQPELLRRIEYRIVEPSARRQGLQRKMLREFAPRVRWFKALGDISQDVQRTSGSRPSTLDPRPASGIHGIIFSNELLDAMPVHRLGWDARERQWFEWGVAWKDGRFVWERMPDGGKSKVQSPKSSVAGLLPDVPLALQEVLPDGFTTEICPAAESWWREAAALLNRGKIVTIDYGLTAVDFFKPERKDGTLRAYYRHHASGDILANAGEQDITAHVNFSAIQAAGEAAGLSTEAFQTQAQFLTDIVRRAWQEGSAFGPWTPQRTRQFQTLTHPEHLGRAFRVLIQSR